MIQEIPKKRLAGAVVLVVVVFATTLLAADPWRFYGTDKEGKHLYRKAEERKSSPGIVRVWDHLVYSAEGRASYLEKRKRFRHPTEGFEGLAYRMVLYELNCFSETKEYVMLEVFEVDQKGRTLDYAKAGGYKDWQEIPDGLIIDLLYKAACPAKRMSQ